VSDFTPTRCPNQECPQHHNPAEGFYVRNGHYHPACRKDPVPRYKCRQCKRGFSNQTFRHDYRDHRPETNAQLLALLVSGIGLRQSGRLLGLSSTAVVHKLRKFGTTCGLMHGCLAAKLPEGRTYLFDEEETIIEAKTRPATVVIVMEREHWFICSTGAAPIRRLGPEGSRRRNLQDQEEAKHGVRKDESHACVKTALEQLRRMVGEGPMQVLTDEKSSYRSLIREVFGALAEHSTTPGTDPRTAHNPLFPINVTMAMTRDNNGRLRRKTWLHSKKLDCLIHQLVLFAVYRNYIRKRFNSDQEGITSATSLGLLPRALTFEEVLRWRQDWGPNNAHPTNPRGGTQAAAKLSAA
jgi:transposase-like protein